MMELLKDYIFKQVASGSLDINSAKLMLEELKSKSQKVDDEIAIIGMACRFPGAKDIDEYWSNLEKGVNCIADFPADRIKDIGHLHMNGNTGDTVYNKGGFLDDIDKFDAKFFNISPREAKFIDPVQRLFLETAWMALEDAGHGGKKISGTKTGVFVGNDHTNVSMYKFITEPDQMHLTGSWSGILATRIMYILNLKGPGMVIDTACSSGMTAVHQACEALKNRECEMALAGGICLGLVPAPKGEDDSMEMIESYDYTVRSFDRSANGTVWGEGVGVVLLKPLSKAIEDKDNIYAVIKGSAINNDGASNGITAPNAEAQEEVLIQAWKNAKVNPETISYIEAHGTGTALGDPIEIKGLSKAFKKYTSKKQFCAIGSVKTNVGHLVGASGMASLLKVLLSLKNGMIPASLNFKEPNPYINFFDSPVYVNDKLSKWETGNARRRAGVSSFGFSGTNCHIVLEESPEIEKEHEQTEKKAQILALSAYSEEALTELVKRYASFVNKSFPSSLEDICYTANTGRGHYTCRLVLILKDYEDLREKIAMVNGLGFKAVNLKGIFYKEHKIIKGNRDAKETGEITEDDLRQIHKRTAVLMQELQVPGNDYEEILNQICGAYLDGADIEWNELYKDKRRKRVSIPVYPLERVRHWAAPRLNGDMAGESIEKASHPLLGTLAVDSVEQTIYVNRFAVNRQWELNEHKIMGNSVLPGTAYVEMMREAGQKYYKNTNLELRNMVFSLPLVLEGEENREVHTVVKKENGYLKIIVVSRLCEDGEESDESWLNHAECEAYENKSIANEYEIREIMDRCSNKVLEIDLTSVSGVMELGTRWKGLKKGWFGQGEFLAEVEMPVEFSDDIKKYGLHPALLDCSSILSFRDIGEGVYLPLSYRSFKVYGSMPERFYGYICKKGNPAHNSETMNFDITLMDPNGKVFAEIQDYVIKKIHEKELNLGGLAGKTNDYYEISWVPVQLQNKYGNIQNSRVLILKDSLGIGDKIIQRLKNGSNEVIEVEYKECYRKISDNKYTIKGTKEDYDLLVADLASGGLNYIIHLAAITEEMDIDSIHVLKNCLERGVYSLLRLTRSIMEKGINQKINLLIAADYTKEVTEAEETVKPHNAAMFGLGKVLGEEYSNLYIKCIDIDPTVTADDILSELAFEWGGSGYQAAYRRGIRFVEEFGKLDVAKISHSEFTIKENGVYIITGGTGGIGLAIGKYLASKGNVNLAIIGRTRLPEHENWGLTLKNGSETGLSNKIKGMMEIEEAGAMVLYYNADVSDFESMKQIISGLREGYGQINGVIHCAGVAGDGFAIRQEEDVFSKVMLPKIEGTWVLDKLTDKDDLDFFVMFSSISTLYGIAGQGNYIAGNSYMDAFAAFGRRKNKKTLSINWPSWREVGMAVHYGALNNDSIFKAINTSKGLRIFEEVLGFDLPHIIPVELNYSLLAEHEGEYALRLSEPIRAKIERVKKRQKESLDDGQKVVESVKVKGKEKIDCSEIEKVLAEIWGRVLGLREINIYEEFHELGGDSILATQLLKETEKVYPGYINISDIFTYPSVVKLAAYITQKLDKKEQKYPLNEKAEEELSDMELKALLDDLEAGKSTTERSLEILLGKRMEEND